MALIKQGTTYARQFLMVSSSDHVSGRTGVTPTITVSKNGGTFAAAAGSVSELANGFYTLSLTTADTNTFGDLAVHATASGADPTDWIDQIVGFDPTVDIASFLPYGTGPVQWVYTLTRSDNGQPIVGASINITADAAGTSMLAGPLITDASGQVTAFLPLGTVYVWRTAAGYSFVNPDVEVVV